jgi:D-xylose transport system substrate-binding protein
MKMGTKQGSITPAIPPFLLFLLLLLVLSSCTGIQGGVSHHNGPANSGANGKGCNKIGVLLPDSAYSARWDSKDRPDLINDIKKYLPDATVDYANAEGDVSLQETQADDALKRGDCILVVGAEDSVKASTIVQNARKYNVPVIAYDRLIQDKFINSYVSFDNLKVGELQGQYIATHYQGYLKEGSANVAMINGAQTDNNALLFRQGALEQLEPLFNNGQLKKVYDTFTPSWNNDTAKTEMDQALANNHNDIQIVYAANDGVASGVISSLKSQKFNGKVLVTGQDATVIGIRNIIIGDQGMTVYKNVALEADATARIVELIKEGKPVTAVTGDGTTKTSDGSVIPSIFELPVSVDKTNIATTVLADGYVTKSDICQNLPAGTNTNAICS